LITLTFAPAILVAMLTYVMPAIIKPLGPPTDVCTPKVTGPTLVDKDKASDLDPLLLHAPKPIVILVAKQALLNGMLLSIRTEMLLLATLSWHH
jgi:hypothetical protein